MFAVNSPCLHSYRECFRVSGLYVPFLKKQGNQLPFYYLDLLLLKIISVLAYLYNWSYPCYAGNLERWRCPAPQHWLPVHWSGVSCECVPRLNLIGGEKIWIYQLYLQKQITAFPHTDTKQMAIHWRLCTCTTGMFKNKQKGSKAGTLQKP